MSKQMELVRELVGCRDFLMQQLEDLALDEGRDSDALGWRWLRKFSKYPTPRSVKGKPVGWGWSFTRSWNENAIRYAEKRGPSLLPWVLLSGCIMSSSPIKRAESALIVAAQAMGELLTQAGETK